MGDCSVQHHGPVRHGEFHGVLVAVDVVALAEEPAVQAENFGIGGDDYFRQRISVDYNVGLPIRRHIVDFRDLGIGVGRIPGDGVETSYPGYGCVPVEHAASHVAGFLGQARREDSAKDLSYAAVFYLDREDAVLDDAGVCHTARALEGSTSDVSRDVVCHCSFKETTADGVVVCHGSIEDAVLYGATVCHTAIEDAVLYGGVGTFVCHGSIEGAVLDGAVVFHTAIEGAVLDVDVVFHTALALEGTTADGSAVCHVSFKGAVLYGAAVCHAAIESAARDCSSRDCSSGDVFHFSRKGAVASDGAAVCHTVREEAARDRPFVVCHACSKVAAGNCRILFQFNATVHSLLGRPSSMGFGIEVVEIIRSIRQSQYAATVLPAVALGAVRTDRIAGRAHDELWEGAFCKSSQGEHGEHHAQCQDQAENAFFHWGRPPLLPKAARSFVSGFIIP